MEHGRFGKGVLNWNMSDITFAHIPLSMTQSNALFNCKEARKYISVYVYDEEQEESVDGQPTFALNGLGQGFQTKLWRALYYPPLEIG